MDVFIIGITGRIGSLLAQKLLLKGDTVRGLVRRDEQRADLAARGVDAVVGDPGTGTVSLGPAEFHDQVARADVAETLAELLHEPRIGQQILELNAGSTPIRDAVEGNVRRR